MNKPRTFEEIMAKEAEKLDQSVIYGLERRAKKRLLENDADYRKYEEEKLPTLSEHCDAIKIAAKECVETLQAKLAPVYKPYIEYLICVANSGCFQPHETAFLFIEHGLLRPILPDLVLKFVQTHAVKFGQTALIAALSSTADYLNMMGKMQADIKSKLDTKKSAAFIKVFDELFHGLKRVSSVKDPDLFVQCFTNVKLSMGMAVNPPVDMDKMEKMTSLIDKDAVDNGWLGFVEKFLRGLDKLNTQYLVLVRYSRQLMVQNCEQEIGLPNLSLK